MALATRPPTARRAAGPARWRWAAGLGALTLAATGAALTAPATARAAPPVPVNFATRCVPPPVAGLPPINGTTTAEISVDRTAPKVGDTVTVTYRVTKPAASNPVDIALPADIMTPSGKVVLGGAQTGQIAVKGPKKNPPVPGKGAFPGFSMTGTFKVTAAGSITLSPGDYTIHTSYIMELDTPCAVSRPPAPVSLTITASGGPVANQRAVTLGAASGKPGERVTVTGTKFAPLTAVTVAGRAGAAQTADRMTLTTDSGGGFTARLKVNDTATTGIVAYEGASWTGAKGAGPAPYTVKDDSPLPKNTQKIHALVANGTLSMSQAGDTVQLSKVDFGTGGGADGALRTVTVKDFRGGPAGWSLTGRVSDFAGPGGSTIGADRFHWAPACTTAPGSPSTCAAGSEGPVGSSGATLASAPDGALTGGEFTVDAGLSLKVPAFTPPGAYAGVLTLTLT
ncbi:beta-xylosidase [Streptomyces clavuligerus]|uniref:beta-xylosidase n=1 Tax=Streptomyces clavuligerus TaxID=1901 RepID=UPI0001851E9E|nr:beta-xylosidase [Streptomyces clavuligerus]ANW20279.1 beta-xylosidase [Streptomyces clavuligerus]AXU14905.1 beta-xylosidase [Streptomyces clavuligerus]MBY6304947.1 beta-xylosidase [Streptomyces clavuligerus]QCS07677.1 beta-xylosidase [Streptomyces clavuligerus]QPJ92980.1 beta-xylosidase [Streptomyces clavuligerus]